MSKCDLCGDHCDGRDLEELRDMYRVAGIKDICPKCSKWANGELRSIRDRIAPTMRQSILDRMGQRPSIWTRVFKLRGVLP